MLTITEYSQMVSRAICELSFPAQPSGLYEPVSYTLESGGKRLRPVLTLAACEALGGDPKECIPQAIGIEMFHNFTLLHDDVMDHSDMRRGRPTVHVKWDERTAILSGDLMLTLAGMLISKDCPSEMATKLLATFNSTAIGVYEGQQYDMDFESREDVSPEEYFEMIRLKTSVLLGGACKIGAIRAGASQEDQEALWNYGENLGLAFQLQDDYLDSYGDPATFGKPIGGDILNEKKTWLLITARREAPTAIADALALSGPEKIERVKAVYDSLDLPARSRALIHRMTEKATSAINSANVPDEARQFFIGLAEDLDSRTR